MSRILYESLKREHLQWQAERKAFANLGKKESKKERLAKKRREQAAYRMKLKEDK